MQVSDDAFNAEVAETMPTVHYELPTGYHQDFGAERQRLPELFFDPQTSGELRRLAADSASASGGGGSAGPAGAGGPPGVGGAQASMLSLPAMLQTAATLCDVDVRGALYGGIVLVGGNSLVTGLSERLQHEVLARLQTGGGASLRMKLIASSNSVERRFAPWLGGSILASLGTVHQWPMLNGRLIEHSSKFTPITMGQRSIESTFSYSSLEGVPIGSLFPSPS